MKEGKTENLNREKWLHLRLTGQEHGKLYAAFLKTTERSLSAYSRKVLLGEPLIARVRNESMDELLYELIRLRKDLNGLANNFNQAVHRLHTLDYLPQVIHWVEAYEKHREKLFFKIDLMQEVITGMGEEWLR